MFKLNSKWLVTAALATTLLAACGGGGDLGNAGGGQGSGGGQVSQGPTNPSSSAQGVVDFLLALIANETSDLTEPIATDNIIFATEELAEPSPI